MPALPVLSSASRNRLTLLRHSSPHSTRGSHQPQPPVPAEHTPALPQSKSAPPHTIPAARLIIIKVIILASETGGIAAALTHYMERGTVPTDFKDCVKQFEEFRELNLEKRQDYRKLDSDFRRGSMVVSSDSAWPMIISTEAVFAKEVQKLQAEGFKALEQLTLEPYERDHAVVVAQYRPAKKQKTSS